MASRSTKKSKSKNNKRGNNGGGNRTKLTVKKMDAFIVLLDNNGGIVTDAAANLNLSRTCLYEKRTADAEFKERWDEAVEHGIDKLEDEAKRRALDGTEEPVYYQGEGKIVLTENPSVQQGRDVVEGHKIIIFLNENRSIVEGSETERVKATIFPKEEKGKE